MGQGHEQPPSPHHTHRREGERAQSAPLPLTPTPLCLPALQPRALCLRKGKWGPEIRSPAVSDTSGCEVLTAKG